LSLWRIHTRRSREYASNPSQRKLALQTIPDTMFDPRKHPRQARSRALVEAILDAAARILAQHGREALTTNVVAMKAGVSIGSLYQYFPNRESVIAAVAGRHGHMVYHHVADLDLTQTQTLEAAVESIVGGLFAAHRIEPALHAALHGELSHGHGHHGHAPHQDARHHSGTKAAMVAQLRALPPQLRDEIRRADITLAAVTVAEIVHAMAHSAIVDPDRDFLPEQLEREAVRAALAYLRTAE
jgi:AcrR family transcriptional regulator